jgi:hypothetical protein
LSKETNQRKDTTRKKHCYFALALPDRTNCHAKYCVHTTRGQPTTKQILQKLCHFATRHLAKQQHPSQLLGIFAGIGFVAEYVGIHILLAILAFVSAIPSFAGLGC